MVEQLNENIAFEASKSLGRDYEPVIVTETEIHQDIYDEIRSRFGEVTTLSLEEVSFLTGLAENTVRQLKQEVLPRVGGLEKWSHNKRYFVPDVIAFMVVGRFSL